MAALLALLLFLILILCVPLLTYSLRIYNELIRSRNFVFKAQSAITVELKRRHDLLSRLEPLVSEYMSHERTAQLGVARERLGTGMDEASTRASQLLALVEAYPNLKADVTVRELGAQLRETEDRISSARDTYNQAVLLYENTRAVFPNNLLVGWLFESHEYYVDRDVAGNTQSFQKSTKGA